MLGISILSIKSIDLFLSDFGVKVPRSLLKTSDLFTRCICLNTMLRPDALLQWMHAQMQRTQTRLKIHLAKTDYVGGVGRMLHIGSAWSLKVSARLGSIADQSKNGCISKVPGIVGSAIGEICPQIAFWRHRKSEWLGYYIALDGSRWFAMQLHTCEVTFIEFGYPWRDTKDGSVCIRAQVLASTRWGSTEVCKFYNGHRIDLFVAIFATSKQT